MRVAGEGNSHGYADEDKTKSQAPVSMAADRTTQGTKSDPKSWQYLEDLLSVSSWNIG